MGRMSGVARDAVALVVDRARSRSRHRVVWALPALGGGNYLYLWMYAWARRREGQEIPVLHHAPMDPWLEMFPRLQDLTIRRSDVPFLAERRMNVWNQAFEEYGQETLDAFIDDVILSSPRFAAMLDAHESDRPARMINVRRGDYYSNPEFRSQYGMDLRPYAEAALNLAGVDTDVPFALHVISDDPEWCRRILPEWFPRAEIIVPPREDGALGDLARLITAERLILANSTFSYWAGYVKNRRDTLLGRDGAVIAPEFHVRSINGGRAFQLPPQWQTVDNVDAEMARRP